MRKQEKKLGSHLTLHSAHCYNSMTMVNELIHELIQEETLMQIPGYLTSAVAAKRLDCTYPVFMRKYSKTLDCVQIHERGPRLFLEEAVERLRLSLAANNQQGQK